MERRSLIAAGLALPLLPHLARAQSAEGLTDPVVFPAFDPLAPACAPQRGLSRTLVFARDNDRDFIDGVDAGLSQAAKDRSLEYVVLNAENDAARMVAQIEDLKARRVGAVVIAPVDVSRSAPLLKDLLRAGTYVGAVVPPPATTILNAPQYLTGKVLGDAAVAYIQEHLEGRATAMRDCLRQLPEVTVVADISPLTVSEQGGFDTMSTILLAEPRIDVVLGADTVVLGALAAMRAAGLTRPDQFFGGIDGEPEAVAELLIPESPYKACVSLAAQIFGYAMGQQAADWIEGRSIPKAIDVLPYLLTIATLPRYTADIAEPGAVYADAEHLAHYLKFYGNTCTDSRDEFVNFPWSSEAAR